MLPHVTTRSGTPMPRKLSVASSTTMLPTAKVATTMAGETTLGSTWRNMMRVSPAPAARVASTNSRPRRASVSPRTRRA